MQQRGIVSRADSCIADLGFLLFFSCCLYNTGLFQKQILPLSRHPCFLKVASSTLKYLCHPLGFVPFYFKGGKRKRKKKPFVSPKPGASAFTCNINCDCEQTRGGEEEAPKPLTFSENGKRH